MAAAATLLPFSILVIAGSAAAARLLARHLPERVAAAGLALIGLGVAMFVLDSTSAVLIGSGMAVAGFGIGLSSLTTTSIGTDVPEESRATASGIVNTSAQLGTAIGTASLLLIAAATAGVPDSTTGAPVIAWAAAATVALVAAAAFARLRPEMRGQPCPGADGEAALQCERAPPEAYTSAGSRRRSGTAQAARAPQ